MLAALAAAALVVVAGAAATTGDLTFAQCLEDEDTNLEAAKCGNAPGLGRAFGVAVSADGRSVYAASQDDDTVVRFNRNPATGALSFAQCFEDEDELAEEGKCTDAPGLGAARSVALTGDGESLYAAASGDGAIVRFDRNPTTGAIGFVDCFEDDDSNSEEGKCTDIPGLDGATSVTASGNGRSVYAASTDDAIVRFDRNPTTGAISFVDCFEDEDSGTEGASCPNIPGLGGAFSVTASPDQRSVYSAAFTDGIVRFNRDRITGAITFANCFDDEDLNPEGNQCSSVPGLGGARSVGVSGDGRSLYAAANSDDTVVRFNRTTTGAISFAGCFDDEDSGGEGAKCADAPGLDGAVSVTVSGDGGSLYAAAQDNDSIVRFNRTTTGAISFANCFDDEDTNLEGARCANAPGLDGARSVRVSGDEGSLYAASQGDNAVVRFDRELLEPPPEPSNDFTIGKLKRKKLTVIVPGPGAVGVTDAADQDAGQAIAAAKKKRLKPSNATATDAGEITVKLKLKRKAKKKLRSKGKVKVRAAITYTPTGGSANTKTKRLKVKTRRR